MFICYKETDDAGQRTQDSVIANDIYYQLTHAGFKVFYAAITLEDKLGKEYEPYIFSALNTAKVMLALGTKPEYFNAVWVKNEWSRFLKIMKKDRSRLLIPCYRDMDPYELPEEFAHLQAQDMSKIGFINDIVRGIKKVIVKEPAKPVTKEPAVMSQSAASTSAIAQVKRGNMALEDHAWAKADGFFEEALNLDPECAEAYIGKLLAKERKPDFASWTAMQKDKYINYSTRRLQACQADTDHIAKILNENVVEGYLDADTIRKQYEYDCGYDAVLPDREDQRAKQKKELASERLLSRAQQYAKDSTKKQIKDALAEIEGCLDARIDQAKKTDEESIAGVKATYARHIAEADKKVAGLNNDAKKRQDDHYQSVVESMNTLDSIFAYEKVRDALKAMKGYKDSDDLAGKCQMEIDRLKAEEKREVERQEALLKAEAERAVKKRKRTIVIVSSIFVACVAFVIMLTTVIIPKQKYNAAVAKYGQEYVDLFNSFNVGDTVIIGSYEQDNNISNGKEGVEWLILAKEGNKILLSSRYALDCQRYNTSDTSETWETCSLRKWLNDTFLSTAFSEEERAMIHRIRVSADKNPRYSTNPGNNTTDQVFLLSIKEANQYFNSNEARKCAPTAYAIAQGALTSGSNTVDGMTTCGWWLRSPGLGQNYAAYVLSDGSVINYGYSVRNTLGVRPALWVSLY